MVEKNTYFIGVGRRKTAVATVKLMSGNGVIVIDGKPIEERFTRIQERNVILNPMMVTDTMGKFNAVIKVLGGGVTGQSGAIAHGIARALEKTDEKLRAALKSNGLLTRDDRTKERKKPGLKRARKAPQYTKR
ncbi:MULTISPECIES: 30S ribosomal protein S9 [Dehalococcoides]|jgi:small subunit ribosomal protein S9|uniref:Small ribosomal subunit protein uS9 n=2 Tax=Dehalococcoides mccartyi TaxID=61435 RepID=RS9_DEHMC|nr:MULTISPECIES: 30S ribosomal protein S9 [Dehalococcoides]Q3ZZP2.1 RecName: Full=Small ribosomal subunit protein uS9; AltName: Full=30S ribosomal protein S9 [Dehalococcoides mccartyi CBDB1]AGG06144.1 30S ribosomal protein S9 [Dehalococcoides mccartyi DCMB5]AGG07576.1 30S ribosomal protein S9 [Dehalococcoides mccartyi BTF08]AII60608.1 30S ribosomal protein S9 [Dehalococcoides mccartyi CG5]AMU86273.1 30S ribosomal protein S9 [Dehalococcoides mccartyi]AOV99110.1 30S ribosomal protein S9 [Dehalo